MLQLKGNSTNVTSATNLSLAVAVRIRATNAGTVTVAAASGTSNHAGQLALVEGEVVTISNKLKMPQEKIKVIIESHSELNQIKIILSKLNKQKENVTSNLIP